MLTRLLLRSLLLVGLVMPLSAFGLGVGALQVRSALYQNLEAEIPLVVSNPAELIGLKVQIPRQQVFDQMGVERQAFFANLRFAVQSHPSGSSFIKITSTQPIRDPNFDLLIEAVWPRGRLLRTFPVQVDPEMYAQRQQPPPPILEEAQTPAPNAATPATTPAAPTSDVSFEGATTYGPVRRGENLSQIARQVRPSTAISIPRMKEILVAGNPEAFSRGNPNTLRVGATLRIPTAQALGVEASTPEVAALNAPPAADAAAATAPLAAPLPETPPTSETAAPAAASAAPEAPPSSEPAAASAVPQPVAETAPTLTPVTAVTETPATLAPVTPAPVATPPVEKPAEAPSTTEAPSATPPAALEPTPALPVPQEILPQATQPQAAPTPVTDATPPVAATPSDEPPAEQAPAQTAPTTAPAPAPLPEPVPEPETSWLANPLVWIAIALIALAVGALILLPILRRPARQTALADAEQPAVEPEAADGDEADAAQDEMARTRIEMLRNRRSQRAVADTSEADAEAAPPRAAAPPVTIAKPAAAPPKPIDELLKNIDFNLSAAAEMSKPNLAGAEARRMPDAEPPTASVTRAKPAMSALAASAPAVPTASAALSITEPPAAAPPLDPPSELPSGLQFDKMDFDLSELGLDTPQKPLELPPLELAPAASSVPPLADKADEDWGALDFELPAFEPKAAAPAESALSLEWPAQKEPPEQRSQPLQAADFKFEFSDVSEDHAAHEDLTLLDADLQHFGGSLGVDAATLDLATPASAAATSTDYLETKLDLAAAYLDMGDQVGARGLLEDVAREGDANQKQRAEELLKKLS